jgi:hypothetical protein
MKHVVSLFLTLLWMGCAGASVSIVRKELSTIPLPKSTLLFVAETDASQTEFQGDGADSLQAAIDARRTLSQSLSPQLVEALRQKGYRAQPLPAGGVVQPVDAIVIRMVVTRCDWGSNAARALVGFGAGAAYMLTDVKLTRRNTVVADFTIDATSGAEGGLRAIGDYLPRFVEETARLTVQHLRGKDREEADEEEDDD